MGSLAYMKQCYELTNAMKYTGDEEHRLCRSVHRILTHDSDLLVKMLRRLHVRGVSAHRLSSLLRYVSRRTLSFYKPYERITRLEAAQECGMCVRTAQRAFDVLVLTGFLHKMCCNDEGSECYYALNVGKIHREIRPDIDALNPKMRSFFEMDELHRLVVGNTFTKMHELAASFANTLIHGIKSFINKAREACKTMASTLLSSVTAAKAHATAVSKKKSAKRADGDLFTANGHPDGRAGLEHFYRCVEDYEYKGVARDMTGKMRGLMGHFMRELRDNYEYNDEDIRYALERLVGKWRWVPRHLRGLQQTTKDGKTFRAFMPDTPDFAFFFTHRAVMMPLLRRVEIMSIPKNV